MSGIGGGRRGRGSRRIPESLWTPGLATKHVLAYSTGSEVVPRLHYFVDRHVRDGYPTYELMLIRGDYDQLETAQRSELVEGDATASVLNEKGWFPLQLREQLQRVEERS